LHISVDLGFIDTIEALIYHNADPNTVNSNGETPILIATKRSNWTALRMLLAKGGNPNLTDRFGNAALHIASLYGHLQMVKLLLKHGAELNQKGNMGATPPYIAAREGHVHLVQDIRLINIKIPCLTDKKEKGIIHIASEHGHVETVLALVDQFKADINLKDSDGNTPLH
ncbi:hypothetical protein HELRODRAFT_123852, partial [Helobdella robusta]|uniref:Uncharacterized protein n=1 Tax=Helobdella robusta TaxID=6412 RepID=T1EGZ3_HELRO